MKKIFISAFLLLVTLSPIFSAQEVNEGDKTPRKSVYVSGGTWNYGVSGRRVYSNYYHSTRKHTATVINYQGYRDKDYQHKRKTARAALPSGWGTDSSYYGFY